MSLKIQGIGNTFIEAVRRVLKIWHDDTGWIDCNGKRFYVLTTAITANVTTTTAPAGSEGRTTHATGKDKIFTSDGTKWQAFLAITPLAAGTFVAPLTENTGSIGGTNDGNLPDLTATVGAAVVTTAATQTTPYGFATQAQADNLVARVNALIVDNVALRAAIRENAAKENAIIASLEGNGVLASS